MGTLYERIIQLHQTQHDMAVRYEEAGSYEMAYLSLWIVLEKILKDIDTKIRSDGLYVQICEWKNYLENKSTKKPREIKSFNLKESERIPDLAKIEKAIGEIPVTREIMNTQAKNGSTKWRDKRNSIAHNAESFAKKDTYEEYRDKILSGTSELTQILRDKNI